MIEFARTSTHLATLSSSLKMIREAAHPNVRPMLDFFHFWSGLSKFEDLDMIRPGEIAHCHFQDILDTPRELIDNNGRVIPGDGAAPIVAILKKLAEKQYSGRSIRRAVPDGAAARRSVRGGKPYQTEVRDGDASGRASVR
jgi:sugar phosphate isomerase/epimerase